MPDKKTKTKITPIQVYAYGLIQTAGGISDAELARKRITHATLAALQRTGLIHEVYTSGGSIWVTEHDRKPEDPADP